MVHAGTALVDGARNGGLLRVEVIEEGGQQLLELLVLLPGQLHRPRESIGYVGHAVPQLPARIGGFDENETLDCASRARRPPDA